jgi:outer membrane biosynthesis protein TonB
VSGGVAQSVRACGSYPQCPGFESLHRQHFHKFKVKERMVMKKLFALASVVAFLLSLQGASLAQEKAAPTPATPPVVEKAPAPVEVPVAPKEEVTKETKKEKAAKKKKKKKAKGKKKKPKVEEKAE